MPDRTPCIPPTAHTPSPPTHFPTRTCSPPLSVDVSLRGLAACSCSMCNSRPCCAAPLLYPCCVAPLRVQLRVTRMQCSPLAVCTAATCQCAVCHSPQFRPAAYIPFRIRAFIPRFPFSAPVACASPGSPISPSQRLRLHARPYILTRPFNVPLSSARCPFHLRASMPRFPSSRAGCPCAPRQLRRSPSAVRFYRKIPASVIYRGGD